MRNRKKKIINLSIMNVKYVMLYCACFFFFQLFYVLFNIEIPCYRVFRMSNIVCALSMNKILLHRKHASPRKDILGAAKTFMLHKRDDICLKYKD